MSTNTFNTPFTPISEVPAKSLQVSVKTILLTQEKQNNRFEILSPPISRVVPRPSRSERLENKTKSDPLTVTPVQYVYQPTLIVHERDILMVSNGANTHCVYDQTDSRKDYRRRWSTPYVAV